jgi:hypothetical protein
MVHDDSPTKARMTANLADFLELLSLARAKVMTAGQKPTEIPDDLKTALLRLISE